jgi:hypothetical protein
MIKSLTSLAIMGLLGAAVIALPGFAPQLAASEAVALAKADRLEVPTRVQNCSQQVWPSFDSRCLRSGESGLAIHEVRLVNTRH